MSHEIEFGSPEHIAGLSREALEQDFAWMVDRNHELEGICDRLDAENADLKKRLETIYIADPDQHGQYVLNEIDRLRRDLSDYHGHLKAHSDLQVHCDRQRERIADLEWLYAKAKAEIAKLKEQTLWMAQTGSRWEAAVRDRDQARAENARLRSCLADADENARQIMGEYGELEAENARLRKELEMEREDNSSIRRLFDAVAPQCGKPDCPSLVEYVEQLRELVRDMHKALFSLNLDHCQACPREDACVFVHKSFDCDECAFERDMRELGIEVGK